MQGCNKLHVLISQWVLQGQRTSMKGLHRQTATTSRHTHTLCCWQGQQSTTIMVITFKVCSRWTVHPASLLYFCHRHLQTTLCTALTKSVAAEAALQHARPICTTNEHCDMRPDAVCRHAHPVKVCLFHIVAETTS
jgi:hypothetical protein